MTSSAGLRDRPDHPLQIPRRHFADGRGSSPCPPRLFLPGIFESAAGAAQCRWSLSYEPAFYLISAASFVVARRLGVACPGAVLVRRLRGADSHLCACGYSSCRALSSFFAARASNWPAGLGQSHVFAGPGLQPSHCSPCRRRNASGLTYWATIPACCFRQHRGGKMPAVGAVAYALPAIFGHDQLQLLSMVAVVTFRMKAGDPEIPARQSG